ncbi:GNAT family N-acetyltransferase [Roseibium sp. Sym1]|uniref:GNAT family N-acetyltransferase n=1 Tax=Roseibium sp. Sym1 TaxID=3016006 RepID=UPI0022B36385|nr:GNAT family N-acetyltransferase [Roseibium sp. Sym1]
MSHQGYDTAASVEIRPATRQDARDIASLFLISSDGLAAYIWSLIAEPGADLLDVGTARYERENTAFSYQNCHMIEVDGHVAGMLHAFEMTADDTPETDPVLRPYSELEDPGSLYVSGVAVHEAFRRRGLARRLMEHAYAVARAQGLPRVSLICFDRNTPALDLYVSLGFREIDRRAVVPHPSLHYPDGNALLLVRDLERQEQDG